MLTVRFEKFASHSTNSPSVIETYCVREAKAIHVRWEEHRRAVIQLGDAPNETTEVTVGEGRGGAYDVAYVMNSAGKTVDRIV